MQLNQLKKNTGNKTRQRVGRGSTRGKTSGRGHKGQKSRAGHSIRPAMRDEIKKLPKRRGHGKNRGRTVNAGKTPARIVNLAQLEVLFAAGDRVTPQLLLEKGVIRRSNGRVPQVKVLGNGTLKKKLVLAGCEASASARAQVEAVGGEVLA